MSSGTVIPVFGDEVEGRSSESSTNVVEKKDCTVTGQDVLAEKVSHTDPIDTAIDFMDTVLVRGLSASHSQSVLKLYFTNKRKCGGENVTSVILNGTQAYISFADSNVAARVAEKKVHKIVGSMVEVELVASTGTIESVTSDDPYSHDNSDNILILDSVPQTIQDEVLLLYIDNITELEGEDGDYTIDHSNTEVMITFKPDRIPPGGLDNVMTKIFSIPLDDNVHIQARRPVLLANNVFENTTTQRCTEYRWLERCAANSNNSETDCYRERETFDKEKSVVHSEIDDSIESLSNKTCSPLGEDVDHVTQHKTSPGLSVLASSSEVEPKQEFFTLKVSKPLINCVKKNQKRIQEMLTPLCADISIDMELEQLTVNPCPGCESLEGWKTTCQSAIESYMTSLVSETVSFSSELKTAVLSLIANCTESHPQADIKFDEENLSVVISGEKPMVDDLKDQLCKLQKVNTGSKGSKVLPFLKSKLNMFHFKSKPRNCSISVSEKVKDEEDFVFVDDYVMSCTTVGISNDIARFLSTTRGNSLLQSYLKSFETLFTVTFDHSGQLVILCSSKDDGVNAAKKIKEQVVSVCVPFNLPKMLLPQFKGKEWITLRSSLEETHSASIILSSDRLTVLGDKRSLVAVKESIQKFLEGNCYVEKSIPLCWAQWRLLTTHMIDKWVKVKRKLENESMIKHVVPNKEHRKPSIVLKGGKPVVSYFAKEVENLVFSICTSPPIEQARPGTVKFFYSEKGTTLIRGIETEEKSCIQLDVLNNDTINESRENCCTKLCTGKTKDGTTITLVKGDITEFPVDVIVNAANCDLKHIGGVALAIAKKGGPIIQEDSDCFISREGKLSDGDAVMAKEVGKLPCKRLIHAVGPKWSGGLRSEDAVLKKACLESLKLASDYRTVSFPAISSGVFSFPVNKCAEYMMKAFLEYCVSCALSVLCEITVVVRDNSTASAFTQEMCKNLFNFQSARQFSAGAPTDTTLDEHLKHTTHLEHTSYPENTVHPEYTAYPDHTVQPEHTSFPEHTAYPEYTAHPDYTAHPEQTSYLEHTAYLKAKSKTTSREPIGYTNTKSDHDVITQFIQLHKGELLKQKADVYVNTVSHDLNLRNGAVSMSLLKAGGKVLQNECTAYVEKNGKVHVGRVVVTGPGSIQCKKIIHTVGPSYDGKRSEQVLQRLVLKCMETCDTLKASSIAFPALGAGTLNYPSKVVADIMVSTIVSYLKTNITLTCIKTVKLVIYMDDAYVQFNEVLYKLSLTSSADYQSEFVKKFSHAHSPLKIPQSTSTQPIVTKPQPLKPGTAQFDKIEEFVTIGDSGNSNRRVPHVRTSQNLSNSLSSWIYVSDCKQVSDPLSTVSVHPKSPVLLVQIYAETLSRVKKTKDRLERIIDDQFTTDALTDELIAKLSNEKKSAFTRKAKQKHVEIFIKTSAPLICVQLRGDRNDVADLKFEIQQELNQIRAFESFHREAKLLQDKIKWWWWINDTKQYKDFDFLTNYRIERAYQSTRNSVFTVETKDLFVECNFMKMEAKINHSTHMIRRVDLADMLKERDKQPSNWTQMPKEVMCTLVELNPRSQEYITVKTKFEESTRHGQIVKIERIQNTVLYSQYMARKRTMEMKNPPGTTNEIGLFHGCPRNVADKISHQGYNRSFAGKNATLYGKGVYFARDASFSANDQYSSRDQYGYKYVFLNRVLTGQYTAGNPSYITPPPKSPGGHDLYDSVVDNIYNPSIFVIFADAQAYPDYLITFI